VLSSRIHIIWALTAGGALGVGNDPVYNKGRCFDAFPFPALSETLAAHINELAEKIDAHRKHQQAAHPELTVTGMYNVLEKLRADEPLTTKEKAIHQQGIISLLRELHDDLDRAVFEAYGWPDLADKLVGCPGATTPRPDKPAEQAKAEETLLTRLVELNAQRTVEEAQGHVRWLRPEYQAPSTAQISADFAGDVPGEATEMATNAPAAVKQGWPKSIREQIDAVRSQLATAPQTTDAVALNFKRKPVKSVTQVLAALEGLGHIQDRDGVWYLN